MATGWTSKISLSVYQQIRVQQEQQKKNGRQVDQKKTGNAQRNKQVRQQYYSKNKICSFTTMRNKKKLVITQNVVGSRDVKNIRKPQYTPVQKPPFCFFFSSAEWPCCFSRHSLCHHQVHKIFLDAFFFYTEKEQRFGSFLKHLPLIRMFFEEIYKCGAL